MASIAVLIVGAGPTGLVLGLSLARRRVPFRIIDRNPGPGLASRAMAVHARTLEFYDQLGIADAVVALGVRMNRIHLRESGAELAHIDLGAIGGNLSPYPFVLCLAQDDHERFLAEQLRLEGVEIEWGVELRDFEQDAGGVRARLTRGGEQESCDAAYLCGADGVHSAVRQGLAIEFAGGTYAQRFFVADVALAGPASDDLFGSLGARALALCLPVRRSGMKRLIGTLPAELDEVEAPSFADVQPHAEALLGVRVERLNWFSTYRVHHRVAEHFQVGRVFIAGDAGHVHSPAGGQGMNTGIGDAINLAWKLASVIDGRAGPALLDTYEPERIAFARKLVDTTDRAFEAMVDPGWAGSLLRTYLMPLLAPLASQVEAVRRMMFRTVSQTRINYRESALSQGRAGQVHAGDRLPWLRSVASGNYASLRALNWRLHVYGAVGAKLHAAAARLGLPIDVFAWSEAADDAGLARDAAYLLRPDGHVALALADQEAAPIEDFVERWGLRQG